MVVSSFFCSGSIEDVHSQLKRIIQITNIYRWIIDAYVSDFFVKRHWDGLPRSWREFLTSLTPPVMVSLLDPAATSACFRSVRPLSLMAFQICVSTLSLKNTPVDLDEASVCESLLSTFQQSLQVAKQGQTTQQQETRSKEQAAKNQSIKMEAGEESGPPSSNISFSALQELRLSETLKPAHQLEALQFHTSKDETKYLNVLFPTEVHQYSVQREKPSNMSVNTQCDKERDLLQISNQNPNISNQKEKTQTEATPQSKLVSQLCVKSCSASSHSNIKLSDTSCREIQENEGKMSISPVSADTCRTVLLNCGTANEGDSESKMADSKSNSWDASKTYGAAAMKNGQCMAMEHIFRKHVKPKKQHEIQRLSKVISLLCDHCNSSQVIDVGAGLGHLSRLLTFAYNVKVTTVEAAACHAPKAVKFDHETKTDMKKAVLRERQHQSEDAAEVRNNDWSPDLSLPNHVVSTISASMSTEDFLTLITRRKEKQNSLTHQNVRSDNSRPGFKDGRCHQGFVDESRLVPGMKITRSTEPVLGLNTKCLEECPVTVDVKTGATDAQTLSSLSKHDFAVKTKSETKKGFVDLGHPCCNNSAECVVEQCQGETTGKHEKIEREPLSNSADPRPDVKRANMTQSRLETGDDSRERFVLASLHACGDLTPTLLRVFVDSESAAGLASVGCCYMKLSTRSGVDDAVCDEIGYPMSEFVGSLPGHQLSFAARELACHFIGCYCQRLRDNSDHLKIHGYRAAVQLIILGMRPDFRHGEARCTVKNATQMKFEKYAECISDKVGLGHDIPDDLLKRAQSCVTHWKDVVAFYVIRLSLAPLIETLILLDRMVYLYEKGISSTLVPIFEPRLSPRNYVLLASKL
ncbi:protein RRNAD1-like [Gigantopelta aegis]|uniref:protein RRNAD1-like n=1 Tax=Gigantopelta aegis TaxID=1735272 RepID=UPI001B88AAD2|nr:protein RRNAD1-like [Gigantopelta aegis]